MGKASSWHEEEGYALMVAGLEVSAMETMKVDKLHDELEKAYVRHLGFVTEGKASDYDVRDGATLWTKMQEIQRDLGNVWRPLYNRVLPGGKLPSGTQLDDFKERFCNELWLAFEKGKELIKIKAAHAEDAKHVGARVALQQPVSAAFKDPDWRTSPCPGVAMRPRPAPTPALPIGGRWRHGGLALWQHRLDGDDEE
jgi:hypothetical protein